jgi:hypothetical protein
VSGDTGAAISIERDPPSARQEKQSDDEQARLELLAAREADAAAVRRKRALELLSGRSTSKASQEAPTEAEPPERTSLSSELLKRRRGDDRSRGD